uniref:Superoxide dismutase copper/zinc binding domain-containing protein n=1 Tax=Arcella intermedia TaxID=1963864 RepID=A0A6B2LBH1_9EUKA
MSTLRNFICNSPSKDGIVPTPRFAVATFKENLSNISGYIYFQQPTFGSKLEVVVNLTGLIPFKTYKIDIHTYGDLRDNCLAIGPIFDVQNRRSNQDGEPLTGDIGMVIAESDGSGVRSFNNTRLSLFGAFSLIGRAVLVHLPDYGGDCAVIGIANETTTNPTPTSNETTISTSNQTSNTYAPVNETTGEESTNATTPLPSPSPMPQPNNTEPSPAPMPEPNDTQPSPSPSTPQPVTPSTLVQKTIVVVNSQKDGEQLGHVNHKLDKIKTVLHHLNHSMSTPSAVPHLNNHSNPSK